ncbi:hypothetical protein JTB14_002639 [Gonioctena quinquepunctata]|nr:hypothetical protein JTB14_002639 [Gonioctena quinquepunctata]
MSGEHLLSDCVKYQKILYHPIKKTDFFPENGSEVFVKNIPIDATDMELAEFFGQVGNIFQLRLMMAENGVENRGFCYVSYMNSTTAKKAISDLNFRMFRRDVFLNIENSLNNCRIFIGGIPTFKTKDQVWQELDKNGVKNIVDVIMYRSYSNRSENRGFVFVEFKSHEMAANFRAKFAGSLRLWGTAAIVDWSVPVPEIEPFILNSVKILYIRNLSVTETTEDLQKFLLRFIEEQYLEKVYKFKNYAFVHLSTRSEAEKLMTKLRDYYRGTVIDVEWAKPPNRFTTIEYRQQKVELSRMNRPRTHSSSSNFSQSSNTSYSPRDEQLEIDQKPKAMTFSECSPDLHQVDRSVVRGTYRSSCHQYVPQPCYQSPLPQISPHVYSRPLWARALCPPSVYTLQRHNTMQNPFPNYWTNFTQLSQRSHPTSNLMRPAESSEYDPISEYQKRMTELYGREGEDEVARTREQCDFCDLLRKLNL